MAVMSGRVLKAEPVEPADDELTLGYQLRFLCRWDAVVRKTVDHKATAEGSVHGVVVVWRKHVVSVKHLVNVSFLRHVNCESVVGRVRPFVVHAQIVRKIAHEVNFEAAA